MRRSLPFFPDPSAASARALISASTAARAAAAASERRQKKMTPTSPMRMTSPAPPPMAAHAKMGSPRMRSSPPEPPVGKNRGTTGGTEMSVTATEHPGPNAGPASGDRREVPMASSMRVRLRSREVATKPG